MTSLRGPIFLIAVLVLVSLTACITLAQPRSAQSTSAVAADQSDHREINRKLDEHGRAIAELSGRMNGVDQAVKAVVAEAEASSRRADFLVNLMKLGGTVVTAIIAVLVFFGVKSIRDVRRFRDEAAASQQAAADSQEAAAKCAAQAEDFLGRTKAAAEKSEELHKAIEAAWDQAKEKAHALQSVNPEDLPAAVKTELDELKAKTDLLEILGMPLDAAAYLARGNAYYVREEYERAIKCYDRAIELKSDYAEAYLVRGAALDMLGRYEEALAACDRAIELKPRDANAHLNRGGTLVELARWEEAEGAFHRAIELNPSFTLARLCRALALGELNRWDDALATLDLAIEVEPDNALAHNYRGETLLRLGRHEQALGAFDRAIELNADDADAYYNRACAYSRLGKKDDASGDLRRAIELDPKYPDMAKTDEDFENLHDDPEFRKLVGLD